MQAFVDLVAIAQDEVDVAAGGTALLQGQLSDQVHRGNGFRECRRQGAVSGGPAMGG